MAEISEKYATYSEVPLLRMRWFFIFSMLCLTPLGILIAITGDVYFPHEGRVKKLPDGVRFSVAIFFAILMAWQVGRVLLNPDAYLMAFDHLRLPHVGHRAPPPPHFKPESQSPAGARPGAFSTSVASAAARPFAPAPSRPAPVLLRPDSVTASSFYAKGGERHPPGDAFDGVLKTAWNEGAPGPGQGQWIEARFNTPRHIRRIELSTGFDYVSPKYGDLFSANPHLRAVRVLFDGGKAVRRAVPSSARELTLDGLDVTASSVRIIADKVWEGTRWQDLAISEIRIEGDPVR